MFVYYVLCVLTGCISGDSPFLSPRPPLQTRLSSCGKGERARPSMNLSIRMHNYVYALLAVNYPFSCTCPCGLPRGKPALVPRIMS